MGATERKVRASVLCLFLWPLAATDAFALPLVGYDINGNQTSQRDLATAVPTIVAQPRNVLLQPGRSVFFSVVASGAATYQWRRDGTNVAGATNDTLAIAGLATTLTNYGQYSVIVGNSAGSVTSAGATVFPDTDADGMADAKELELFWDLDESPSGDTDGDGAANYDEAENGTSPTQKTIYMTNAMSWFQYSYPDFFSINKYLWPGVPTNLVVFAPGRTGPFSVSGFVPGLSVDPDTGVLQMDTNTPPLVTGLTSVTISAPTTSGLASAVLQFQTPDIYAFGDNFYYQNMIPAEATNVVAVAGGYAHSLALRSDGKVVPWGPGEYGQTNVPPNLAGVVAIACGYVHSLAVTATGSLFVWGNNMFGQTNLPPALAGVTAVAAGGWHSLALKSDGTVTAWGNNDSGQANVPAGMANVVAVAAGQDHSLALKYDGTVVAWGGNQAGQATVPPGLSNVVALAAGGSHSLALRADGTVVAWGGNRPTWGGFGNTDQSIVPPGLSNVVALAAGVDHSLALKADGKVVAWGGNSYGQTTVPPVPMVAVAARGDFSLAMVDLTTVDNRSALIAPHSALGYVSWPFHLRVAAKGTGITYSATGLPNGLAIDSATGLISGTPTQAGFYDITLRGTGPGGQVEKPLKVTVLAVASQITSATRARLAAGRSFSYQITSVLTATNYSATGLPAGLSLNSSTGLISGVPTTGGSYNVVLTAQAQNGQAVGNLQLIVEDWRPLGGANLVFEQDQFVGWTVQSVVTPPGINAAARSGNTADSSMSYIETTVNGPGAIAYWGKVSSEYLYDRLQVFLDGTFVPGNYFSGEYGWFQQMVTIPLGAHTVRWQYSKDSSLSSGMDAAFIAQVVFVGSGFSSWNIAPQLPENRRGPMDRNGPMNLPNFLSYSMALDPRTATPADMPALGQRGTDTMKFIFRRAKNLTDADLRIMSSTNLSAPWSAADVRATTILQDGGDHEKVEATVGTPQGATRFFLRLNAEQK